MKKQKKLIATIGLTLMLSICLAGNVHANVQSVKNSSNGLRSKTASQFFALIRQMESSTGPMGLGATIDATTGAETGTNNIDAHMIKNTEWGAMVMLMDSQYGSKQSGRGTWKTSSSTGNATGVYEIFSGYEYVAGMIDNTSTNNTNLHNTVSNGKSKYVNLYATRSDSSDYSGYKIGDATGETPKWKNANFAYFVTSSYPVFKRGDYGAFTFVSDYVSTSPADYRSRAAVVCGSRILNIH